MLLHLCVSSMDGDTTACHCAALYCMTVNLNLQRWTEAYTIAHCKIGFASLYMECVCVYEDGSIKCCFLFLSADYKMGRFEPESLEGCYIALVYEHSHLSSCCCCCAVVFIHRHRWVYAQGPLIYKCISSICSQYCSFISKGIAI